MAFVRSPGVIYSMRNVSQIWVGIDADKGLFAFNFDGKYVISKQFAPSIKISRYSVLPPVHKNINGEMYWGNDPYIYKSLSYGDVLMFGNYPGCEPVEYKKENGNGKTVYYGDDFYAGSLPVLSDAENASAEFSPRGANRDKDKNPIVLTYQWERWESKTQFGEYEPKGGATGKKTFGSPYWVNGSTEYIKSLKKTSGRYTYGSVHYSSDAKKWLIGTYGSAAGWHEGEEPEVGKSAKFTFMKPKDSEINGSDITLEFKGYTGEGNEETYYLFEVALWL